jgi:hypothetical protein
MAPTSPAIPVPAAAPLEVAVSVADVSASETQAFSEEVRLLEQAQQARAAGRCELALLRLAEYGRRFPGGTLRSESIAAEVLCLCELGRSAEAEARARGLIAAEPQSALVKRLLASCVGRGKPTQR